MKPLEKARIQKGLSFRQMQDLTGVSFSFIGQAEKSQRHQSLDLTVKVAKGLNTSIDFLIGINPNNEPLSDNDKLFIKRYTEIEKALKKLNEDVPPRNQIKNKKD